MAGFLAVLLMNRCGVPPTHPVPPLTPPPPPSRLPLTPPPSPLPPRPHARPLPHPSPSPLTFPRRTVQSGHYVWPAAPALSAYLADHLVDDGRGRRLTPRRGAVLELGAGCGLAGLVAAQLAGTTAVIFTDHDPGALFIPYYHVQSGVNFPALTYEKKKKSFLLPPKYALRNGGYCFFCYFIIIFLYIYFFMILHGAGREKAFGWY